LHTSHREKECSVHLETYMTNISSISSKYENVKARKQSFFSSPSCLHLFLLCGSVTTQPAPASVGEESEEDQQFRNIFQEIPGDVSSRETRK